MIALPQIFSRHGVKRRVAFYLRKAGLGAAGISAQPVSLSGHVGGLRCGGKFGQGSIKLWIVGATGFRQSLDRPTGLELLWQKLRSLSAPDVCVLTPQAWDADAAALAEYIARNSAPGAEVFFYGYSYGVGAFFIRFARALKALDMGIAMAVTIDGIRRFRFAKILSLRFFDFFVSIPVPANVREVYAYRQSEDGLLRGHRLIADDPDATTIHDVEREGFTHDEIDEDLSAHRVALVEAGNLAAAVADGRAQL